MTIRTTVGLTFSYAVLGVPQNQEEKLGVPECDVTIEERQVGKTRKLYVTMHDEIHGLKDFNHIRLTHDGKVYEGVGRMAAPNQLLIELFHDQPALA